MNPLLFQELIAIPEPAALKIGGKGMGLLQLHHLGLVMPPAWVLPTEAFTSFIASLNLLPQLQAVEKMFGSDPPGEKLEAIRQAIANAPLPPGLIQQVHHLGSQWAAGYGGRVIVRSSATIEDNQSRSFAGIFDSIPCQSDQEVADAIRHVWASVFSPRAFAYYSAASLTQFPAMALILQPFVEADRSGVMFTRFAGPDQTPQVLVEHVEGDCEKLVKGLVNPDRFWLRRWPAVGDAFGEMTGELQPHFALELAQAAEKLEMELGRPQDVEWCVRQETLYFLQTRPITVVTGEETAAATAAGEVWVQGVGASPGYATGSVHLVFNIEDAETLVVGQVLTTTMTNPDMVPTMQRSAAVVTDVGGMICHAAIISRELGIPCVVGTGSATRLLQPGSLVTVNGSTGVVFKGQLEMPKAAAAVRDLQWSDLWQEWQSAGFAGAIPLLSTYRALAAMPPDIGRCVLDPFCDLYLDPSIDISPLFALAETTRDELLQNYLERLDDAVSQSELTGLYLALHRLDPAIGQQIKQLLKPGTPVLPLEGQATAGSWQIQVDPDKQRFALLEKLTPEALQARPTAATPVIPLGFGRLLRTGSISLPNAPEGGGPGMFGMMPAVRLAPMPARQRREAMHRYLPTFSAAHGGQIPVSDEIFPWLDLRPEVPITTFLKAFVTPGVEAIPFVLGFATPPLYIQFIRCRFHFRQDTLFAFFPKLMQATWDENFLSDMLQRCRLSYDELEAASAALPATAEELAQSGQHVLQERFLAWWRAFCNFFSLSFFIQAQGDDCVFPALGMMAEANTALWGSAVPDWRVPGVVELAAPVTPVLTAEYIKDLLELKQALAAQGISDLPAAEAAIQSEDQPAVAAAFARVRARWHWMRERDPYYDPYDTPQAILEKALAIRSVEPPDYETNRDRADLALALHFDLGRLMDTSEKLVYAIKYGRALAIDRENHHVVWLRASYRLRQLLLEWERRLRQSNDLQPRDIFFMHPWEILDAVSALPQPMAAPLLDHIRNRRLAYEQEIQLKAGKASTLTPLDEQDYY